MGCTEAQDEKVEETPKTLEEQLEDAKAALAAAEQARDDNHDEAETVESTKAAAEAATVPYDEWNGGSGKFWKLNIEVDKKRKAKLIISELNRFLREHVNREDYQLEHLYPSWNTDVCLEDGKKLKKQLKNAQKAGAEDTFDARDHQPCVLFGIDADNYNPDAWEGVLTTDEEGWVAPIDEKFQVADVSFEGLEDSDDDSDDSDGDNIELCIALRCPVPTDWDESIRVPKEEADAAHASAEEAHGTHHHAEEQIPELQAEIERLEAAIAAAVPEPEPEPEPYVPTDHWFKVEFEVDKKTKPKKIIHSINKMLAETEGTEMQIEALVPTWTPTYDALENKKLIKQLKHSKKGEEDYDARGEDPIKLIGIDNEQFDADTWNEHLDFSGEEFALHETSFEGLEDSDGSDDDSSGDNVTIQVGLRVIF